MAGTLLISGGLLADDVTGIGIADDVAIPFILAGGAIFAAGVGIYNAVNDAKDPNGAKAPGKPGAQEGFKDPKGGDAWIPNPNGRGKGWKDANGDVWVPTGQGGSAHGGPHWDVQNPRGGHINVYPGGRRR